MNLLELLEAVKDEKLGQRDLELMRDQLIHLRTSIHIERAELKKKRAMFLLQHDAPSIAAKKVAFDVTPEGQRLFTLEGYATSIKAEIESLQARVYSMIRLV